MGGAHPAERQPGEECSTAAGLGADGGLDPVVPPGERLARLRHIAGTLWSTRRNLPPVVAVARVATRPSFRHGPCDSYGKGWCNAGDRDGR
jgi:hypothetical protein